MGRITVGYQDACLHPLWLTNAGLRIARLMGAESLWLPDHYMGFIPSLVWKPEITPAAKVVHSPDGFFDPITTVRFICGARDVKPMLTRGSRVSWVSTI